jgi:hypothetical protein
MTPTNLGRLAVMIAAGIVPITTVLAAELAGSAVIDTATIGPPSDRIVVSTLRAQPLAAGATLVSAERIIVVVHGFGPSAPVQVLVQSGTTLAVARIVTATRAGDVRLVYQVPDTIEPGPHVLDLTGPGPTLAGTNSAAARDEQNVTVTVPNVGVFPFTVA